jgi:hypothetical protein
MSLGDTLQEGRSVELQIVAKARVKQHTLGDGIGVV